MLNGNVDYSSALRYLSCPPDIKPHIVLNDYKGSDPKKFRELCQMARVELNQYEPSDFEGREELLKNLLHMYPNDMRDFIRKKQIFKETEVPGKIVAIHRSSPLYLAIANLDEDLAHALLQAGANYQDGKTVERIDAKKDISETSQYSCDEALKSYGMPKKVARLIRKLEPHTDMSSAKKMLENECNKYYHPLVPQWFYSSQYKKTGPCACLKEYEELNKKTTR